MVNENVAIRAPRHFSARAYATLIGCVRVRRGITKCVPCLLDKYSANRELIYNFDSNITGFYDFEARFLVVLSSLTSSLAHH